MHILILTQEYAPEEISTAILLQELSEDLVKKGYQVTCVTRAPNYPLGKVFPGYKNRLIQKETLNGVRIIRVWSVINENNSILNRMLKFGSYSACAFLGGLMSGRPDLLVCYSPPLPLGISAWLLSKLWSIPWILRLEDVFPEAAVAAGVFKNRFVIRIFDKLADFLYARADHIALICDGFRRLLSERGIDQKKLSTLPVWADPDIVIPAPKQNNFRNKYNLSNKFVLMYAGILGYTSAIEDMAYAAQILRDNEGFCFVIIGEGIKKDWIINFQEKHQLENLLILPFQPRIEFPEMMAAADVGMVTLNDRMAQFSLPHKIFNIMSSERPILAVAPEGSDLSNLIINANCGIVVPPQSPDILARTILKMQSDSREMERLGHNGRMLLLSSYSRQKCISEYEKLFCSMVTKEDHG